MALNLLFMSLEDVHEPRGRLQTGGCTLLKDPDPPQGLEEDLNEFAQDLAFTTLQERDGAIHVWYSLRRSPEQFPRGAPERRTGERPQPFRKRQNLQPHHAAAGIPPK